MSHLPGADILKNTKAMIDGLKTVCANAGLANDSSEHKIITEAFLYKFLNDKYFYNLPPDQKKAILDYEQMTNVKAVCTPPDIHYIFPRAYCEKTGLPRERRNSIVNKAPLITSTNRTIDSVAPSKYLPRVKSEGQIDDVELRAHIESHPINFDALAADDFDTYFIDRAKRLLDAIERAMGKAVPDRGSEETIKRFGQTLVSESGE